MWNIAKDYVVDEQKTEVYNPEFMIKGGNSQTLHILHGWGRTSEVW